MKMEPITEETKQKLEDGEIKASVCISTDYFEEGDYSHWKEQDEETAAMTYEEYQKHLVAEMQETYECIRLHSDGTLYGIENGTSHDISYNEFDDIKTFIELAEKFGIDGTIHLLSI